MTWRAESERANRNPAPCERPPGAESFIYCTWFKRGAKGFIFRWDTMAAEWLRSTLSHHEFEMGRRRLARISVPDHRSA